MAASERNPENISTLIGLAKLNFLEGKNIKAQQIYDKILSIDPDNTDALLGQASVLIELGRYDDALNYFDEVLEVDPENFDAQNGRELVLDDKVSESLDLILIITIVGSVTSVISLIIVILKIKENVKLKQKVLIADEQIEDLVDKFMKKSAESERKEM